MAATNIVNSSLPRISAYFKKFYSTHQVSVPNVGQREFGFGFDKKINYRHRAFSNGREFQEFLVNEGPLFASYSVALFEFPWAQPMPKKSLLSADLVFDIDSKPEQGGDGKADGGSEEGADGVQNKSHNKFFCHACVERSKKVTQSLLDNFLFPDFGFSQNDVQIVFSGSKGFHVHVRSPAVAQLSGNARRLLVDYITGRSLSLESIVKEKLIGERVKVLQGPTSKESGWPGHFYNYVVNTIRNGSVEEIRALGLTLKRSQYIVENKQKILELLAVGNWDVFHTAIPALEETFDKVVSQRSVEIDSPVTFDIHRLIRVPGTLHGDTALVAKPLTYNELEKFNPTRDAIGFGQTQVSVEVKEAGAVEFAGQNFEFHEGKTALPLGLALLLACKGKGQLWE